jgi:uncharacterized peroxidase-related enzyme
MAFIDTIEAGKAKGSTRKMYAAAESRYGFVPNMVRAFSHRPNVMRAWSGLLGAIRAKMDPRRYELATLAAAQKLRSSYCSLAHAHVLLHGFYEEDELEAILETPENAALDETDRAIMRVAAKVAGDATAIDSQDIAELRGCGLSDAEIFDVVATAAVRCFFSKTLDALGVEPDSAYVAMEPKLRDKLAIGRPIEARAG